MKSPYLQDDPVAQFRSVPQSPLSHLFLPLSQRHIVQSALVDGKPQLQTCRDRTLLIIPLPSDQEV